MPDRSPTRVAEPARADLGSATQRLPRGIDGRTALELVAVLVSVTAVVGGFAAPIVAHLRDDSGYATSTVLISAACGLAFGAAATIALAVLRRNGARAWHRLGRQVWSTGVLPRTLPLRIAALRDLERRERTLDRGMPLWIAAAFWTAMTAYQLSTHHTVLDVVVRVAVLGYFVAVGIRDIVDRRNRRRLQELIAHLRDDPAGVGI